jgi:hypothetical protein
MEYFHPESKTLLEHPECACCGKPHQDKPGAILAIYETFKDRRSDMRTYFPYLHLVCKLCFTKYNDVWTQRVLNGNNFSISEELENEMTADAPGWSEMWSVFTYPDRPFRFVAMNIDYEDYLGLNLITFNKGIPLSIMRRIQGFANSPNLEIFAFNINGEADLDFWNEHILFSDWQEPEYNCVR